MIDPNSAEGVDLILCFMMTCACGIFALFGAAIRAGIEADPKDRAEVWFNRALFLWLLFLGVGSLVAAFTIKDHFAMVLAAGISWGLMFIAFIACMIAGESSTGPGSF